MQLDKSRQDMLVIGYNGLIEEMKILALVGSITRQLEIAAEKKTKVVISLGAASYEANVASGVAIMIKKLEDLSIKLKISIALIDYSIPLYKHLKKISKDSHIELFKNINVAKLFFYPKSYKSDLSVLLYDEDAQNAKNLSDELSKYGYGIILAKNAEEFEELNRSKSCDIIITHSALNVGVKKEDGEKKQLSLSKKLIVNLPIFMDTAVETLVSFTGLEAQKLSHSIKKFDTTTKDIICAVMHFSGDIEGYFVLLFPKDIALIAMESLLGEKIDEADNASIMDGVGEFCNVITGSAKTLFSTKSIKVIFDLPKTYASLGEVRSKLGNNNGVWIDMQLDGKPFYMFIA